MTKSELPIRADGIHFRDLQRSEAQPVAVFDLDGTLLDSAPGIANALRATGLSRRDFTVEDVRALVSLGADRLVKDALGLDTKDVEAAVATFRRVYAADPCTLDHLYPHVLQALTKLRDRGTALAICTNKPQHLAELVVRRLNLSDLIPVIVGWDKGRPPKPDPGMLWEAIKRSSSAGQAVLIGDSITDAEAAKALKIPFVFAAFGYGPFDPAIGYNAAINSFAELDAVLLPLLWPEALDSAAKST